MSKEYLRAPEEVFARSDALIKWYHPEIEEAGVKIDYMFAFNNTGDAVSHAGYPALAVCRIVNLRDRAKKNADAEITIDANAYLGMTPEQQDGLLDHELYHIVVQCDDEGIYKLDTLRRPKLTLRKHSYQLGWFDEIAERHKMNSVEVTQAKLLWDKKGQAFFPFLQNETPKEAVSRTVKKLKTCAEGFNLTIDGRDLK